MACDECEKTRREYHLFRVAVQRFVRTLDDLERERVRLLNEQCPGGAQHIEFRPIGRRW